jgi:hypothetical protein
LSRSLYLLEIGSHNPLIRRFVWASQVIWTFSKEERYLVLPRFETRVLQCHARFSISIPQTISKQFVLPVSRKCSMLNPCVKKCHLNTFTGKYLETFEPCILEEYVYLSFGYALSRCRFDLRT